MGTPLGQGRSQRTTALEPPREGLSGTVRDVSLVDLLQMYHLARRTVVLRCADGCLNGDIVLRRGELFHAQTDAFTGRAALRCLLQIRRGLVVSERVGPRCPRSIHEPLQVLLMDLMREIDEDRARSEGGATVSALEKSPPIHDEPQCSTAGHVETEGPRCSDDTGRPLQAEHPPQAEHPLQAEHPSHVEHPSHAEHPPQAEHGVVVSSSLLSCVGKRASDEPQRPHHRRPHGPRAMHRMSRTGCCKPSNKACSRIGYLAAMERVAPWLGVAALGASTVGFVLGLLGLGAR